MRIPTPTEFRRQLQHAAEKLAKQLLEDADKLQLLERSGLFSMGAISHPQLLTFSQQLQSHAKLLSAEAKKEGKRHKRKAPRLALAWLASQVEGSTGKTHYGEIAPFSRSI